jgi:inorganic phosphate transporter, PiT family
MITIVSILAVGLLAYANGANDNFKGVATLYGSKTCSYRTALGWGTLMTCLGGIAAIFLATTLLKNFSGKGLVPESLVQAPSFLLAVALGAGFTVLLATHLGFPISTTHGLMGSLLGAGVAASADQVNYAVLGKSFLIPLLLSPLLAMIVGAAMYLVSISLRRISCVTSESCLCVGEELFHPLTGDGVTTAESMLTVTVDSNSACIRRYQGAVVGISSQRFVDSLHFVSAGAVSFARGLNDTPKIAALLLVSGLAQTHWNLTLVAASMAIGGLLNSLRVAHTMSHKLTDMSPGQGLSSNVTTALLVTTASIHGLPVSTTHVSVGALLGMGAVTRQAKWKTIVPVLASWVITLPCAAVSAGFAFYVIRPLV